MVKIPKLVIWSKPQFGAVRKASNKIVGGSSMKVMLGPGDIECGETKTDLASVVRAIKIHSKSLKKGGWIAAHLLNAELGGDGKNKANLTALQDRANSAHKTFEYHIKRMLQHCTWIHEDSKNKDVKYLYGVKYEVEVSDVRYSDIQWLKDPKTSRKKINPFYYAYSYIKLNYRFMKWKKTFPHASEEVKISDDFYEYLSRCKPPKPKNVCVKDYVNNDILSVSVKIYNLP